MEKVPDQAAGGGNPLDSCPTCGAVIIRELAEALYECNATVDRALHLQTMLALPSSDLRDAISMDDLWGLADVLGLGFTDDDLVQAAKEDELGWLLRKAHGWAIQVRFATVGPWVEGKFKSRAVHPGITRAWWYAGESYEEALAKAIEWAESDPPELLYETAGRDRSEQ